MAASSGPAANPTCPPIWNMPCANPAGRPRHAAMGRAIVREPQAFLMDEPLSNLDAKLRVSMRAQLSRLHERLGVTTVYVTHDQVEAMTLGQRVAVLRGGVLQQCDTPEMLFEHPANLFVAAFIGSPAMNLVEAVVEDGEARFGSCRLPLASGSPLRGRIVLGIRPHDLKLGAPGIAGPRPGGRATRDRDPRRRGHRRAAPARPRPDRRDRRRPGRRRPAGRGRPRLLHARHRGPRRGRRRRHGRARRSTPPACTASTSRRARRSAASRCPPTHRSPPDSRADQPSVRMRSRRASDFCTITLRPIRTRTAISSIVASTFTSAGTPWRVAPKMNSGNVWVWPALNDVMT